MKDYTIFYQQLTAPFRSRPQWVKGFAYFNRAMIFFMPLVYGLVLLSAYLYTPTSYWICSVVSYSQTTESSTPLRKVGYSAFARQGYIRQVHAQPSCFLISLDFYVSAPLFLATGTYLSLAFSRSCHSARDWRGTLSKGCAGRISLWNFMGEYSFLIINV